MLGLLASPRESLAQEPVWSLRFGGVWLAPTNDGTLDATTQVSIGASPMLTFGVIRAVECCVELFVSGVMTWGNEITATGSSGSRSLGSLSATGVRAGVSYRFLKKHWGAVYVSPFVGGFARDRSDPAVSIPPVAFSGDLTIGAGVSYRRRFNGHWSAEGGVSLERARLLAGDQGRINWNPVTISVGIVKTLK